jgi:hypothetical protein
VVVLKIQENKMALSKNLANVRCYHSSLEFVGVSKDIRKSFSAKDFSTSTVDN